MESRPRTNSSAPGDPVWAGGHLPSLDGLRGIAILLVLVHHCFYTTDGSAASRAVARVVETGWIGVELFYVLSGFLITGILVDTVGKAHYYRNFYLRRALRIFPLYYGFLVLYQIVAVFGARRLADGTWSPRPATWPIWCFLSNMPQIAPVGPLMGPLGPLWSLAVEEQIYLIWPALIAALPRPVLLRVFVAMLPTALVGRLVVLQGFGRVDLVCSWTPGFLDAFAAGGIAAILVREPIGRIVHFHRAAKMVCGSGLFLAGLVLGLGHFYVWRDSALVLGVGRTALATLCAASIVAIVAVPPLSKISRCLGNQFLRGCGRFSFAMYLFHTPIFATLRPYLVQRLGKSIVSWPIVSASLVFFATLGVTYLAARLSWRLFEGPILSWKSRFPPGDRKEPAMMPRPDTTTSRPHRDRTRRSSSERGR